MIWLLIIPALLALAVFLTGRAARAVERAVRPRQCTHEFYIFGRCIECGTPR